MATQISEAKSGNVTEEMKIIAKLEGESPEKIRDRVAKGRVVIFKNIVRQNLNVKDKSKLGGRGQISSRSSRSAIVRFIIPLSPFL
ncbi:MAG: phosphomethylpyrimidine synthase ThiC, partial [Acidianus infernus]|nr:phosphomethylpyrimidine synthase ThiC [Acidianus infernus]